MVNASQSGKSRSEQQAEVKIEEKNGEKLERSPSSSSTSALPSFIADMMRERSDSDEDRIDEKLEEQEGAVRVLCAQAFAAKLDVLRQQGATGLLSSFPALKEEVAQLVGNESLAELIYAAGRLKPHELSVATRGASMPTQQCSVQTTCVGCGQPFFFPITASLIVCPRCKVGEGSQKNEKVVQRVGDCRACGNLITVRADAVYVVCGCCVSAYPLRTLCISMAFAIQRPYLRRKEEEAAEKPLYPGRGIHIVVQYYIDKDETRRDEVKTCLLENLKCPHVEGVHCLLDEPLTMEEFRDEQGGEKLKSVYVGKRLTYKMAFDYANEHLSGKVVILMNADIHVNDSARHFDHIEMSGRAFALTRHDYTKTGLQFEPFAAPICQDAWAFCSPISDKVDADYQLGKPGCDNRIAFELRRAGLHVSNPSQTIKVVHRHASQKRNYQHGKDTVVGFYASVQPTMCTEQGMDKNKR
uniref:Uncharacterized protein n=1 Tax=Palpitomonas bilix TaxID=652834 RepID=A0A7S3GBR4_9EUKA